MRLAALDGLLTGLPFLAALPASLFTHDPLGRDQGVFAYIAWRWLQGDVPYLLAGVEHKGPLVFAAYAAAFRVMGVGIEAARMFAWGALVLSAALVTHVARHLWPRERFLWPLAGVLYALLAGSSSLSSWWSGAQTESFMEPLLIAALFVAVVAGTGPSPGEAGERRLGDLPGPAALLAGALVGAAALGKPTALLWLLPLVAVGPGRRGRRALTLLVGAALPWAATLLYFASRGALGAFLENVLLVNLRYGGEGLAGLPRMGGAFLRSQRQVTPWLLLPVVGYGVWKLTRPPRGAAARLVLWWLATAYFAVVAQGRMFPYHFIPVVAPLALVASAGGVAALRDARAERPAWRRAAGALALVCLLAGVVRLPWGELSLRREWRAGRVTDAAFFAHLSPPGGANDVDPGETQRAAGWASAHITPDQTLLVWGFEPAVNFLSGRVCPTRYIYDYFLTSPAIRPHVQEGYWRLFRGDLARRPADWIAVMHDDANPVEALDSATQLDREPELRRLLAERYEPVQRVGDFAFFRRRP